VLCTRRFEQKGFKLVALKMMQADEALLKEHYKDLVKKPFFPSLLSYMTSGPVVPMVWEGDGVVAAGRVILGATKPSESAPGTVRGDYAIDVGRNVCHGISSFSCCLWYLFCFMVCATASVPPLCPPLCPPLRLIPSGACGARVIVCVRVRVMCMMCAAYARIQRSLQASTRTFKFFTRGVWNSARRVGCCRHGQD
jgi:nucleoside diphosphate kinase